MKEHTASWGYIFTHGKCRHFGSKLCYVPIITQRKYAERLLRGSTKPPVEFSYAPPQGQGV